MASIYRDSSRNGWRVQVYVRGYRRKLWLGPVTRSAARTIAAHLDALALAASTGTTPPDAASLWARNVGPRIRSNLRRWGLAGNAKTDIPNQLADFTQHYIDSRDDWKAGTLKRMRNVRRHLTEQLGSQTYLAEITRGDAERFSRWVRGQFSPSHSGKLIADARQYFEAAAKDRLIAENPFAGIDSRQPHKTERAAYVSPAATESIIAKACPYYAALIAIARYGGVRVPSEPLALAWSDVDWERGRFVVQTNKTLRRTVPLFPELRPHLAYLHELSIESVTHPFDRNRLTAAKVYRAGLKRLIRAAGVEEWPKLWMNLRASCRTDLLERFPEHVVNAWLGHSGKVGSKHYDRVHEGHFRDACGVAGGVIPPPNAAPDREPIPEKPKKTR